MTVLFEMPPIGKRQLNNLSPDNCFVAISKMIGPNFRAVPEYRGGDDFVHLRNLLVSMISTGKVRKSSLVIYDPPIPQPSGASGLMLARFWLDCIWDNWRAVHFRCKLLVGSPAGNLPYTLLLCNADIKEPMRSPLEPQP